MTFEHDGTVFDLERAYLDVTGVEWLWSGQCNDAGEPLMHSRVHGVSCATSPAVPLPDVYHDHGPLIPSPQPLPAALYRRVLIRAAAS